FPTPVLTLPLIEEGVPQGEGVQFFIAVVFPTPLSLRFACATSSCSRGGAFIFVVVFQLLF
ncbi:MAG: hypothetical protein J6K83_04310, partial [Bacteroidaceae bacterium]|nr:hypothetical protein [Bacteroidaceae bacterium]